MTLRDVIEELQVIEETWDGSLPVYGFNEFHPIRNITFEESDDLAVPSEFEEGKIEIITLPDRVRIF